MGCNEADALCGRALDVIADSRAVPLVASHISIRIVVRDVVRLPTSSVTYSRTSSCDYLPGSRVGSAGVVWNFYVIAGATVGGVLRVSSLPRFTDTDGEIIAFEGWIVFVRYYKISDVDGICPKPNLVVEIDVDSCFLLNRC
uniref:Uncharacterized protein n=1 Tax=uncultured marine group II/III euryarchaeote KM3_67_D09 TaxID=1456483 RepID=A0A075HJ89_9EURY|nr:hypothetical protein [uncultured marine group II/III euryarchaeote KM3_67_D09]